MTASFEETAPGGGRERWLGLIAASFIRGLRATVRMRFEGADTVRAWEASGRHFMLAFWHRHLLLMRYAYRGPRMTVLISRSRDGELIAQTMRRLGIDSARGSSSRAATSGLRALVRAARSGSDLAITPDGPRGPAEKAAPGVVTTAAMTGLPMVPVAIEASRARLLNSWDRFVVPLPGARVHIVYGEPIEVPRDAEPEMWAPRIEAALRETAGRALRLANRGAKE
ncbi:MAG: lysophospholipid acyltransferase family protein [Holophagales bacterium]|nr:lysophospholipid acyltransferase family protein [Holophagales bacterium]